MLNERQTFLANYSKGNAFCRFFSILKVENEKNDVQCTMLKTISLSEKFTFINKTIFKTVAQLSQYSLTHYVIKQSEYGFLGLWEELRGF